MARFAVTCAVVFLACDCFAASLTGLGGEPTFARLATAVSADGSTIVGVRGAADIAFRWTPSTGMEILGTLPGDSYSSPVAVSANGLAIAGVSNHITFEPSNGDPLDNYRGFHWTPSTGLVDLGLIPGSTQTYVTAMSADGSTVFGHSMYASTNHAFRWTAATGIVPLDDHSTSVNSIIAAVSADGSVAAGNVGANPVRWTAAEGFKELGGMGYARAITPDGSTIVGMAGTTSNDSRPVRWTAGGSMEFLSDLHATGLLVSDDGAVVVGDLRTPTAIDAFRWTAETGLVPLGFLPGGSPQQSYPLAMSADGSILVGYSNSPYDNAFYWDQEHGMRFLKDVLTSQGVPEAAEWKLGSSNAISADGSVIAGHGFHFVPGGEQGGWVAVIPEPATLLAPLLAFALACRRRH